MASTARISRRFQCPAALVLSLSLPGPLLPARAQAQAVQARSPRGYAGRVKRDNLLTRITFKTPEGAIALALPADLRAGETVSGAIRLKPNGADVAQRAANPKLLSDYLLRLGEQSVPVGEPVGRWSLPAGSEAGLWLLQAQAPNAEAAHTTLALTAPVQPATPEPTGAKIALPRTGQADRPLALPAQLEADWPSLHVLIGGTEASFVAASPHVYIVQSPPDVFGKTTLQVRRSGDILAESAFRNDRTRHGFNPWPSVIVGAIGVGIAIAVMVADFNRNFGKGFFSNGAAFQ